MAECGSDEGNCGDGYVSSNEVVAETLVELTVLMVVEEVVMQESDGSCGVGGNGWW